MAVLDAKLAELTEDRDFRGRIAAILAEVRAQGYQDVFIAEAMVPEMRLELTGETGCSTTLDSFHIRRGSDDKALAADIVPMSTGWNTSKRFWMLLGWCCHVREIGWGGMFGLTPAHAKELVAAMERLSAKGWPVGHDPDYEVAIGWEEAHCQIDIYWPGCGGRS